MKAKIFRIMMAISLIIVMTSANIIFLGYNIAIAVSNELETQNSNSEDVQFDTYFKINEVKNHAIKGQIGEEINLCININVLKNGAFANGKIKINDGNFKLKNDITNNTYIKSINKENNEIELNTIIYNNVAIEIPIEFNKIVEVTEEYYSKETVVSLIGEYSQEKKKIEIERNITTQIDWTDNSDITLVQGISKVVDLGTEGILVEQAINTKIQNGVLPRASEEVEVIIPKIANKLPQTVKVLLNGTKLEDGIEYDFKTGVIKIKGENYWYTNLNRYRLIYVYDATTEGNLDGIELNTSIDTKLFTKSNIQKHDEQNVQLNYSGNIVSVGKSITKEIYKGYLYSALDENQTYYKENNTIEVSKSELIKNINLNTTNSYFSDRINKEDAQNLIYYKQTIVDKDSFIRIFGNDGYIYIKDENGNIINVINKSTEADSNGNININYEEGKKNLTIETSRPITEGEITIRNIKYLKGNTGYTKESLKQFTMLTTNEIVTTNAGNEEKTATINLLDTKLEGRLEISNTNLSTIESNKNIQFLIVLKSNSEEHDLWKNPVIEITIPKDINVIGKKISLLNCQEGLKIDSTERSILNNGDTLLRITLQGEQPNYINNVNDGVQIVFYADLNIENTIPTQTKQITMTYTNENKEGEVGKITKDINLKSKEGVMLVNRVSDFNNNGDTIESTTNKIVTGELDKGTEEKIANVNLYAINNYDESISKSVIVGNIPAEGTWSDGEQSANISFQSVLASSINVTKTGARIYYSEDDKATKDSNSWQENIDDLEKVKSFKIEFQNGEISSKEVVGISYKIKIPADIEDGATTLNTMKLSYKYQGKDMDIVSTNRLIKPDRNYSKVAMLSASNEAGIDVKMAVTSNGQTLENGAEVYEGQAIQYSLQITNNTNNTIQNMKMIATHTNVVYYGYRLKAVDDLTYHYVEEQEDLTNKEIDIETIAPGETKTLEYKISANKDVAEGTVTSGEIVISGDNLNEVKISTYTNPIKQGKLKLRLVPGVAIEDQIFTENNYPVIIYVENISGEDLNDIKFKMDMPSNAGFAGKLGVITDLEDAEITKLEDKQLEISIPKLEKSGDKQTIKVSAMLKMGKLDVGILKDVVKINANAQIENEIYKSNELKIDVYQNRTKISVKQTTNIDGEYVQDGDELTYTVTIKNEGSIKRQISLNDQMPSGIMIQSAKLYKDGVEIQDVIKTVIQSVFFMYTIEPKEEIVLEIKTNILGSAVVDNILTNVVNVTGIDVSETSNEITYKYLEKEDPIDPGEDLDPIPDVPDPDPDNPEKPDGVKVTSITLNEKSINLDVRESKQLVATIKPENADNKNVYWSSTDAEVAYVDNSGLVTGINEGTAKIVVTTEDGNKIATCDVTVTDSSTKDDKVEVKGIKLNMNSMDLNVNSKKQLIATIEPENATNKNVSWVSTNPLVASVDDQGNVTGLKQGMVTIIVTTEDGNKFATCTVKVKDPTSTDQPDQTEKVSVTDVKLNMNAMKLELNTTKQLVATIEPANADNKKVYWVSTNKLVASVDDQGNVTAVGKGTAMIVVTTDDGSKTSICTVTVTDLESIEPDNPGGENINVTGVSLDINAMRLNIKQSRQLIATIQPKNATNKNVNWSTSNKLVASVDKEGNVTAISNGTALIIVTTEDGNQMDICTVTVIDPDNTDSEIPDKDNSNTNDGDASDSNQNNNQGETITKEISGLAWIDADKDGIRDVSEKTISDMKVQLLDIDGSIVQITTTDENGQYKFQEVKQGKYYVVFCYDTDKYQITQYQTEDADIINNSDVVENTILINGKKQKVAITKELELEVSDLSDIDAGFIEIKKSDMKLDKYITKVTVQNEQGTKVMDYDNAQLAKTEIKSKYLSGSLVVVEYKIKVTNEGETEEYVSEIIDKMPDDFRFNTEINSNWYQKTDGSIATKELANQVIIPGESKVVTLTLTKVMTQSNVGVSTNIAEICEQSNKLSIPDIDSTPNNNKQDEDDQSKAEIIISVATGLTTIYIIIIIITICMFGIGVYFINKVV